MKTRKGLTFANVLFFLLVLVLGYFAYPNLLALYRSKTVDARERVMQEHLQEVAVGAEASFKKHGTYTKYVPPKNDQVRIDFSGWRDGWHAQAAYKGSRFKCVVAHGSEVIAGMPKDEVICGEVEETAADISTDPFSK